MTENKPQAARGKNRRAIALIVLLLCCALAIAAGVYLGSYYRADDAALAVLAAPSEGVSVEARGDRIVFRPERPEAGLIFYPGGKVQFEAYAPLMDALAQRGVLCVLLRMPGNLAVLKPDAADGVRADFPEITRWTLGGHSLGGVMAADYAAKHLDEYDGLLLLAAYSAADLRDSGMCVLSVVGTEDGVLNREKYEQAKTQLPADALELVITGGCHAYFGGYGAQKGDGTPTISREAQIERTAEAAAALICGDAQGLVA